MDMPENNSKEQSSQQNLINNKPIDFQNNRWLPPITSDQVPPSTPNNTVPQAINPVWTGTYPQNNGNYPPQAAPPPVYGSAPYAISPAYPPVYPQNYPPAYYQKAEPYIPYGNVPYVSYYNPPVGTAYGFQAVNIPPYQASVPVYPSADDRMTPLSVLCSRSLTENEYQKLQKRFGFFKDKTFIRLGILLLIFVLLNIAFALQNENLKCISIFILLSVTFFLVSSIVLFIRRKHCIHNQYQLRQSFLQNESVIELYSDRIAEISSNRRLIIPYESVRYVYEMPEMLALVDEYSNFIVLRSEDMISFDAQRVKEILYPRLQKAKNSFNGLLRAKLYEPLPIPIFKNDAVTLLSMPLQQNLNYKNHPLSIIRKLLYQLPMLISFGILFGTQLANTIWLTASLLSDIFIFSSICFGCLVILLGVLYTIRYHSAKQQNRNCKQPSGVAFTDRGAAICSARETIEIPWSKIKVMQKQDGLLLQIQWNERILPFYEIPWDHVSDREAFLTLLQEHGSLA